MRKCGGEKEAFLFQCRYDLRYLCKDVLGYKDWDVVHDRMVEFLWNSRKKRKLIMVPRGHLKSSVFTIGWTIQQILLNPNIRILIANFKNKNAQNFLSQIKNFLTDYSDLSKYYGEFKDDGWHTGGWSRESITIAQRTEAKPEPTINTCGIGAEQTSQHYDIIIHDDIVARDNIGTPEQRDKVKDFYRDSMSLLEPGGECVVIGCMPAYTNILKWSGEWERLGNLKKNDTIVSSDRGRNICSVVNDVIYQGVQPVYKVKTSRHEVEATNNHPFLVIRGSRNDWKPIWKRLEDIVPGDYVLTLRRHNKENRLRINGRQIKEDFTWLFGFLIGDGWVTKWKRKTGCYSYCINFARGVYDEVNDKVKKIFNDYFGLWFKDIKDGVSRVDSNSVGKLLYDLGLDKCAKDKRIPSWVHKQRPCIKRAFLEGLVEADGCKLKRGYGYRVELCNEKLVKDIQLLALTCGVRPTSIFYRKRHSKPPHSKNKIVTESWSIGLTFKEKYENKTYFKGQQYLIPEYRIDKIESIRLVDEKPVYDLNVTHRNFIANGYVVHNTPWHDDDLYVMLRDDDAFDTFLIKAYEKWTDKEGVEHIDLAFPKKFSYQTLMQKKKEIGPYLFSAQYLLDPYPDEDQEFKQVWFQYYDQLPSGEEDKYYVSTVLDPSLGKKQSNHSGLTTTAVNTKGQVFVLEARRFKRMVELIPDEVLKTIQKFRPNVFGLERFGFQQLLEAPIRRILEKNKLKTTVELLPFRTEDKARRIQSLIPIFSSHNIFIKRDMDDLKEELIKFNPIRKNNTDDIIDSLSWHNVYWDRKPSAYKAPVMEEGTLGWWLKQGSIGRKHNDLFWDMREDRSSDGPVYVR